MQQAVHRNVPRPNFKIEVMSSIAMRLRRAGSERYDEQRHRQSSHGNH